MKVPTDRIKYQKYVYKATRAEIKKDMDADFIGLNFSSRLVTPKLKFSRRPLNPTNQELSFSSAIKQSTEKPTPSDIDFVGSGSGDTTNVSTTDSRSATNLANPKLIKMMPSSRNVTRGEKWLIVAEVRRLTPVGQTPKDSCFEEVAALVHRSPTLIRKVWFLFLSSIHDSPSSIPDLECHRRPHAFSATKYTEEMAKPVSAINIETNYVESLRTTGKKARMRVDRSRLM